MKIVAGPSGPRKATGKSQKTAPLGEVRVEPEIIEIPPQRRKPSPKERPRRKEPSAVYCSTLGPLAVRGSIDRDGDELHRLDIFGLAAVTAMGPKRLAAVGMGGWLTTTEMYVVNRVLFNGDTKAGRYDLRCWRVMKHTNETVTQSLASELRLERRHVARAIANLKRHEFVMVGTVEGYPAISVTQDLHDFAIEGSGG